MERVKEGGEGGKQRKETLADKPLGRVVKSPIKLTQD